MHSHRADQEDGATSLIECVRHHRTERKPKLFARERGEAANPAQVRQSTSPLSERRLGNWRMASRRGAAGVFSTWWGRHRIPPVERFESLRYAAHDQVGAHTHAGAANVPA